MRGFSLVELSIVLVILGLLTGGILSGKALIRAAEIQAIPTEMQRYTSAIVTFTDSYGALPGDFKDATTYWGTASGGCPTGAGSGTQTCNGNNDGYIVGAGNFERYRGWQHLANAGLIEGSYQGYLGTEPDPRIGGKSIGASKHPRLGWELFHKDGAAGVYYTPDAASALHTWPLVLSPKDSWKIDTKTDDGNPAYGNVFASKESYMVSLGGHCATSSDPATAQYDTTSSTPSCFISALLP